MAARTTKWGDQFKRKQTAIEPLPRAKPVDPLDVGDGRPHIAAVYHMAPNPAAPDDRSQDIPRLQWGRYNINHDMAEQLALDLLTNIVAWAQQERRAILHAAGERLDALERAAADRHAENAAG